MIKVLSSSFGLGVQDLGRTGYAGFGVPLSGTMDQYSSKLANRLLNNHKDDAVLEITNGGCKLRFDTNTVVCLTGADYSAKLDNTPLKLHKVVPVHAGSVLSFSKRQFGFRTYLAVKNGFKSTPVLGSRSMYNNITPQDVLKKGDQLKVEPHIHDLMRPAAKVKIELEHFTSKDMHCYKGPEFELLDKMQQEQLLGMPFTISMNNNRMGYQLEDRVENEIPSMLTSSALPGTVQLTPSGKLIILMRDCQVTGGYPRVLQLSKNAINRLAQKSTGDTIYFKITPS